MGGSNIGIGIGVHRNSGMASGRRPSETSCYATGIWIDEGIYRMTDIWANGLVQLDRDDNS